MASCEFCGKTIEKGKGKMLIRDNGKILYFCTNRCEKHMLTFKKKGREQKWTDIYHNEKNAQKKTGDVKETGKPEAVKAAPKPKAEPAPEKDEGAEE